MKSYIILDNEVVEVPSEEVYADVASLEAALAARGLKLKEPIPTGGVEPVGDHSMALAITPVKMRDGVVVG